MGMVYGFGVLLVAGLCQGSFGLGYKKYSPFSWAAFWGIYNIMCIIVSVGFCLLTAPRVLGTYASQGMASLVVPVGCGAMWGLSAIGFSKGIDRIGMSMVYGISMGISTIVGSVTPMVLSGSVTGSLLYWCGLGLTLAGVVIVTIAGVRRDGGVNGSWVGIGMSIFSGIGSGFMNVGFAKGEGVAKILESYGYSQVAISACQWLPVLVGGCIAGLIFCIGEVSAKGQWHTVTDRGSAPRAAQLLGVSVVWYAALILYGYATMLLGSMGSTIGWILFNALALVISVMWGLRTGEWKGAKKTLLFVGCGVLVVAWVLIALV